MLFRSIRLMHSDLNEPVNIGNPAEMSIEEIARQIIAAVGSSSSIIHEPLPVDDPKVRQPDITRANEQLQWSPTISLRDGLTPTIEYFRGAVID